MPVACPDPDWAAAEEAEEEEEEEEEKPWPPPMRMKLMPYAMYCVFGGMGRTGEILCGAYAGLHVLLYAVRFLAFSPVPERALFWGPVARAVTFLSYSATALIICTFIRYYMAVDGVYVVEYEPPPRPGTAASAAVEQMQIPPPPPEMDMC